MRNHEPIYRDTLYDDVWRTPMIEIGQRYGVSRATIKWACLTLNVPLPPQAYWAHLAAGRQLARIPLPPPRRGQASVLEYEALMQQDISIRPKRRRKANRWREDRIKRAIDEQLRYDALLSYVANWRQAEEIRAYLLVLDQRNAGDPAYVEWRAWATKIADDMDDSPLDFVTR